MVATTRIFVMVFVTAKVRNLSIRTNLDGSTVCYPQILRFICRKRCNCYPNGRKNKFGLKYYEGEEIYRKKGNFLNL